jgi:hypothetical protein
MYHDPQFTWQEPIGAAATSFIHSPLFKQYQNSVVVEHRSRISMVIISIQIFYNFISFSFIIHGKSRSMSEHGYTSSNYLP